MEGMSARILTDHQEHAQELEKKRRSFVSGANWFFGLQDSPLSIP